MRRCAGRAGTRARSPAGARTRAPGPAARSRARGCRCRAAPRARRRCRRRGRAARAGAAPRPSPGCRAAGWRAGGDRRRPRRAPTGTDRAATGGRDRCAGAGSHPRCTGRTPRSVRRGPPASSASKARHITCWNSWPPNSRSASSGCSRHQTSSVSSRRLRRLRSIWSRRNAGSRHSTPPAMRSGGTSPVST